MADKFVSNKEDFIKSLSEVLNTLGLPSDRVHALSTAYYQTHGLGELYDMTAYSSYVASREMFPVTAQFKDSLYKWNKVADVEIQMAQSSARWFTLTMNIDDVLAEAEMINPNLYRYTIPHTVEIIIGDYIFSLDYDIQVQIYDPTDKIAITARYDMDTLYNPISKVTNPNIKVIKQNKDLILSLQLYQYQRKTASYRYIDSSTDVYTINYEDQLIDFTPYYRPTEFTEEVTRLDKSMYYDRSIPDRPTIYYALNEGKIVLTNRGYRGNFIPVRDSSIELSMYVTKGIEGNFEYIGSDIKIEDNTGDEIPFYIEASTAQEVSLNGTDEDDLEALRKKIVDSLHTRSSIITENDLNIHYSQRGNSYKVVKTRDDWMMRVYSIYVPLTDNDNYLVPTNTLNAQVNLANLSPVDGYYKIPELSHFRAASNGEVAVMKDNAEGTDVFDYVASTAFSINKDKRVVETYEMYIDRNATTEFEYNYDKSAYSFMVNRVYLKREPNGKIKFSFNIMTNLANEGETEKVIFHTVDPDTGEIKDTHQMTCDISFESTEGQFIGHIHCTMKEYIEENDMYLFEAELDTDYFIRNSKIDLKLYDMDNGLQTVNTPIRFHSIKIIVQDKGTNDENEASNYGVPNVESKALINVFSLDNVDLVKQYTDISGIQLKDIDENTIIMRSVPFFGYAYILSKGYSAYNTVYSEMDYINTLWLQTQTNFVNNIRFVNTYGASKLFIIGNGVEKLDKVNITLKFRIGLTYNASIDLDYVRDYIVNYFKGVDFLNDESFHVSDIIRKVRDEITDVQKIEFAGINNYDTNYQYIVANYDVDDPTIVPEIINIQYDKDGIYDVQITKI